MPEGVTESTDRMIIRFLSFLSNNGNNAFVSISKEEAQHLASTGDDGRAGHSNNSCNSFPVYYVTSRYTGFSDVGWRMSLKRILSDVRASIVMCPGAGERECHASQTLMCTKAES